jgi:PPM family protein phosphatase
MPARVAAGTSTGVVRGRNEDSAYVGRWLCAVADGMGGHAAGDVASATVIEAVRHFDVAVASPEELTVTLGKAVREANDLMATRVRDNSNLSNMGSTLTAMLWSGNHFALANVGDSRAYLLRNANLTPITEDHVLSNLVANPMPLETGGYIVRFLDKRPGVSPDLTLRAARPGDRYLLCSDGLSAIVGKSAIRDVLLDADDLDDATSTLVRLANDAGAPDNVTVIVVDVPDGTWQERADTPLVLGAAASAAAAS